MQERRNKGLCMICEEPYTPWHHLKHKKAQVYFLEGEEEEEAYESADEGVEEMMVNEIAHDEKTPTISMNALDGSSTFNCMRLVGQYRKRKLHILIDPGSTHNFIDLAVAKEMGCLLESIRLMAVAAANGSNMQTHYKCAVFTWKAQGYVFSTEVRTLPLDYCDLVLGVQWLTTLGLILWEFGKLRMEFTLGDKKYVLRGVTKSGCKVVKGGSLYKLMLQQPQIALLRIREVTDSQLQTMEPESLFSHITASDIESNNDESLQFLLSTYKDIFKEPTSLPPFREGFDHRIPLTSNVLKYGMYNRIYVVQ